MSDNHKIPDFIRTLAEQYGLTRALEKFPDGVMAAAERGLRPVGAMPPGNSPITHPAPVFNPEQYERGK
jgi:hypothetical protein